MSDQADVIQAELDELRTQTARPASSDGDDIELLWNEVTTLQTTVKDAAQQAAEAATQKEDFATHKAAAEQHWQVSSAALAAMEDRISAVSVPSQLTPAPEAVGVTAEAEADPPPPQQNHAVDKQAHETESDREPQRETERIDELSTVLDVLDSTVEQMAIEVSKRMELTEAACLSRVEWLDRRLCGIEGKPVQPVSQLTGALDRSLGLLSGVTAAAGSQPGLLAE